MVECGLTIKPDSIETKLLKFALNNQKTNNSDIPHPINSIKEIEQQRFSNEDIALPSLNKIRRKARKLFKRIENNKPANCSQIPKNDSIIQESKWDQRISTEMEPKITSKTYTCKPLNYYTIKDGEIIKLNKKQDIKKDSNESLKLSIAEIKQIPAFRNYATGTPSKVNR